MLALAIPTHDDEAVKHGAPGTNGVGDAANFHCNGLSLRTAKAYAAFSGKIWSRRNSAYRIVTDESNVAMCMTAILAFMGSMPSSSRSPTDVLEACRLESLIADPEGMP